MPTRARPRTIENVTEWIEDELARDPLLRRQVAKAMAEMDREQNREGAGSPDELLTIVQAAEESGLAPVTLRLQLLKGRLVGTKRGRDWFITRAALVTYLDHRDPRGRPARRKKGRR